MKLIINSASTFKGGSEQVALSFIHECRNYSEHQYYVVIGRNLAAQIDQNEFSGNFHFYVIERRPATGIIHFIKMMFWFKKLEKQVNPDCVISTGGHGYWRPKAPHAAGFNMAHYVYPESPYFSMMNLERRLYWFIRKKIDVYFFKRVDELFVQTDDIRDRVKKLTGNQKVFTISNTVNGSFYYKKKFENKLPAKKKNEIRLLTLSSYYPHKNIEIINKVVKEFLKSNNDNIKFVLTLPDDKYSTVIQDDIKPFVYNIGPIPIEECPSLYGECDLMFLPTLLECFSASYAEAMIMEKPILTSDLGFAHTVCGDGAIYFNPIDACDIARKIIQLSRDKEKQQTLINAGKNKLKFLNTPESRAKKFLSICENLADNDK